MAAVVRVVRRSADVLYDSRSIMRTTAVERSVFACKRRYVLL